MKIEYKGKDQNWQDGLTVYWFELTGRDYGTGAEFDGYIFGVVEDRTDNVIAIVDCDCCSIRGNGYEEVAITNALENAVTDEMRAE